MKPTPLWNQMQACISIEELDRVDWDLIATELALVEGTRVTPEIIQTVRRGVLLRAMDIARDIEDLKFVLRRLIYSL